MSALAASPYRAQSLGAASSRSELPAWPMAALFVGYPLWWILGLGELAWTIAGVVMGLYILQTGRWRVPKGFGIVLAFMLWVGLSVIAIDTLGRILGFSFRYAQYAAIAIAFVYVYNATVKLPLDRILGYLTVFWVWVVAGGYLGLMFPTAVIRTPLAWVLPGGLLSNDLVQQMAVRRLTQFNPDSWAFIDPRPSAPFLYTNNWGNAFSLLLPLVLLYIVRLAPGWRRRLLILALPTSMVPAFLTLNRGMFLGLAVVAVFVAIRFVLLGRVKALLWLMAVGALAAVMTQVLPVFDRLDNRLENSGTNESRTAVYEETISRTMGSPLFGFGSPRPAENVSSVLPPAGTQGQVWMVMFSHGFVGVALFFAVLVWMALRALRLRTLAGVVLGGVLVAVLVEVFYYGVLGAGLFITFVVGALVFRDEELPPPTVRRSPYVVSSS